MPVQRKKNLLTKLVCDGCGAKFYVVDSNKNIICPKCQKTYKPININKAILNKKAILDSEMILSFVSSEEGID